MAKDNEMSPLAKWTGLFILFAGFLGLSGCATIKLGPSYDKPFKEQVVAETDGAQAKVLLVEVKGTISDQPDKGLLGKAPSLLDSVLMQLKKAEDDEDIKTVLLKINTPGGGVTASDILYHELLAFKERTGKKLYVQMMDVAASGGYYIAMAADHVQAHPTSVTGSVGVISMTPDISGTMEKIGVGVNIYKTGESKDMGSPFRAASERDKALFQNLVEEMAQRFYGVVQKNRKLTDQQMDEVKSARIYTGEAAKHAGLVDSLGYLSSATQAACELSGESKCNVVTYRYQKNPNASLYSPNVSVAPQAPSMNLLEAPILNHALNLEPGLYYLYLP
ncbi:MAG: signal peptide peptidase SppA [Thiomicrorhabdus chilensis]|uniref:signal peptide peptidase SppA n=1 Tax=Thiomicrorhabdus chilensis TaxID=63656 RepID=UPI00299E8990|nr:signal peptide peptidase SppA [Thiomicrorhabdus chilensis]MDX1347982.1 signal peptide peptidase SppA [Thiomicrorhabdus chilensis]